jgi:acyl-CoA thioesterase FadM
MITRGGLTPHLRRLGWIPVVTAETIQLKRSLTLFQSFEIETRVIGWDEQAFVLEQQFTRNQKVIANALVRTRFLSRERMVSPREVLEILGLPVESPELPPHVSRWNEDQWSRRSRTMTNAS